VLSRVLGTIREHGLLGPGDHVLVAISGGPDSTALLHALAELAPRLGVTLAAACVDHGLRPEAAEEAKAVRHACRKLGIGCEILGVDVGRARRSHVSTQEAAREVRLAALEQAAARMGCAKVALGHTADDQAETVLFRILRGTGIVGLYGIPHRRGIFVRPLLDVRRAQIVTYLSKRRIDFLSDPSNADRRYARSRIRHDVLPALARENPRVVEALLALARAARAEQTQPWRAHLPPDLYLPRRTGETIDRLVRDGRGTRKVAVREGSLLISYGKVAWQPGGARERMRPDVPSPSVQAIPGPGKYPIAGTAGHAIEVRPFSTGTWPGGNAACFDAGKVRWPLVVRAPRPGDRMFPRSGRGTRKLSDLLIDAKIPRETRAALPVLCDVAGVILFVPGLRPSEVGRPDGGTREWFEVHVAR
jgi:tRNA(Ile)-lysidine synthase